MRIILFVIEAAILAGWLCFLVYYGFKYRRVDALHQKKLDAAIYGEEEQE